MKNFFTLTLCVFTLSLTAQEAGCTYSIANNYSSTATVADGTCVFGSGLCGEGTMWNSELELCEITNPTDSNFDGCTGLNDLLSLLAVYGDCSNTDCGDPISYHGYDYSTVQIGEQCWFSEDLRTASYRNGVAIENVLSPYGSYYDPNNSEDSNSTICGVDCGFLYNFQAVINNNGLCPSGWHVASNSEYYLLINEFGGLGTAAPFLQDESWGWAGNESGFSLLPAGSVWFGDGYNQWGSGNQCWIRTSTPSGANAHCFVMHENYSAIESFATNQNTGMIVRCIKD